MTGENVRSELLAALAELGRLFPDWRLGQTLANLALSAGHPEAGAVWDLEDSEALAAAQRLIERNARRSPEPNQVKTSAGAVLPASQDAPSLGTAPAAER